MIGALGLRKLLRFFRVLVIPNTFFRKEPFGKHFLQILLRGCGFCFVIYYWY
jgi:hypothetical protein